MVGCCPSVVKCVWKVRSRFLLLIDFVWFRNLDLNFLAVTPMYVFISSLSVVVMSVLYTTLAWQLPNLPCYGH